MAWENTVKRMRTQLSVWEQMYAKHMYQGLSKLNGRAANGSSEEGANYTADTINQGVHVASGIRELFLHHWGLKQESVTPSAL